MSIDSGKGGTGIWHGSRAACLCALALLFGVLSPPSHAIVGGTLSEPADWPYMGALMRRGLALEVADRSHATAHLVGSPEFAFSAPLVDCGRAFVACAQAQGAVCLIERGETLFYEKAANCAAGGGVAALIYNNVEGDYSGTLGDQGAVIPTLALNRAAGLELLGYLGQPITLGYSDIPPDSAVCGAAYLGGEWLLTAAHCVWDYPTEALVAQLGGGALGEASSNLLPVSEILLHPNYSPYRDRYDIALLRLAQAPHGVTPIALADAQTTARATLAEAEVMLLGRGYDVALEPGAVSAEGSLGPALYEAKVHMVSNDQCNDAIRSYQSSFGDRGGPRVTEDMLCAGEREAGIGLCFGDSGGPLVYQEGGMDYLVGIAAWGYGCAQADLYDVYTRVAYFADTLQGIVSGIVVDFFNTPATDSQSNQSSGGGGALLWLLPPLGLLLAQRRRARQLRSHRNSMQNVPSKMVARFCLLSCSPER